MAKFIEYLKALVIAIIIAGIYGAIHDQISFTFSEEYFTRFKFIQFNLSWAYESPRLGAALSYARFLVCLGFCLEIQKL